MYKNCIKRIIDVALSGIGIIVLSPLWLILIIAIKVDDSGPVFFRQKRIAQDKNGEKQFFQIFKYRSMKTCIPYDTPTHLLENPEQYITKVGRSLRKTSLDGKDIIRSNQENSVNTRVSQVSPNHFFTGCSWNFNNKIYDFLMKEKGVTETIKKKLDDASALAA